MSRIIILLLTLSLTACSVFYPHKRDIEQGNVYTTDQVSKLRKGMSKEQVRFVMGTPVLNNVFTDDRWEYVYYHRDKRSNTESKTVIVSFKNDRVTNISS